MENLKKSVIEYNNEELVKQYTKFKEEYTDEAIKILRQEIEKRNIDINLTLKDIDNNNSPEITELDEKDFVRFDHSFNRIDLELAIAILKDNRIMFFVDNPTSSDTIPLESEADKQFTIHVYHKTVDEAHQLLDEHFEQVDGKYQMKNMGVKEQLKAFSFHQLHLTQKEAAELIEVEFSKEEKEVFVRYGKIILTDVDIIEKEKDRVIFYYDMIEPLIKRILNESAVSFSKTELLTILEILQIFCDAPDFPEYMENSITCLIGFFLV